MRVAIHQPNYLPWAGYFTKMLAADVFILLDTAQFSKNGYLNRVTIKTPAGARWLSQPVRLHQHLQSSIRDVTLAEEGWGSRHARTLRMNYGRAPHFARYITALDRMLTSAPPLLADCNEGLIRWLADRLGIQTPIVRASALEGGYLRRTERLVTLVRAVGGDTYVSGAGGFTYQDEDAFAAAGIEVVRAPGFSHQYSQLWGAFEDGLSVLDLLFNMGDDSMAILEQQMRAARE